MICRNLYHWLLGFALTALDVVLPSRDDDLAEVGYVGAPPTVVEPDRQSLLLRLPSMNGTVWTPAADVSQAMLDAWPVWETNQADFPARAQPPLELLRSMGCYGSWWRPLRLPGMDDSGDGVISASDMTATHLERVAEWEWTPRCIWRAASDDDKQALLHEPEPGEYWRPAIWAELEKS